MAFWSVKVTPNYIKIVEVIRLLNFQNIHFFRFTLPKNDSVTRKGMTSFGRIFHKHCIHSLVRQASKPRVDTENGHNFRGSCRFLEVIAPSCDSKYATDAPSRGVDCKSTSHLNIYTLPTARLNLSASKHVRRDTPIYYIEPEN